MTEATEHTQARSVRPLQQIRAKLACHARSYFCTGLSSCSFHGWMAFCAVPQGPSPIRAFHKGPASGGLQVCFQLLLLELCQLTPDLWVRTSLFVFKLCPTFRKLSGLWFSWENWNEESTSRILLWNTAKAVLRGKLIRLVVAKGMGKEEGWIGSLGVSRCKLLYTGWINNKVLLYTTGNSIQYPVINHKVKDYKREGIYMYNWISLWYSLQYNIVNQLYFNKVNFTRVHPWQMYGKTNTIL